VRDLIRTANPRQKQQDSAIERRSLQMRLTRALRDTASENRQSAVGSFGIDGDQSSKTGTR
jgi:hypothetical protein